MWVQGPKYLGHLPLCSLVHYRESGSEVNPTLGADAAGGSFLLLHSAGPIALHFESHLSSSFSRRKHQDKDLSTSRLSEK